ncbi:uncharacterized protein [Neodiprion pinetum]|uniref:uncharacterized protein n=1 Tax=Neodiprion pinetum TaxID=441929 RepID=UPI001EDD580E|nr:uncharacterized protein LOC124224807 [Neodiprion pinetum]
MNSMYHMFAVSTEGYIPLVECQYDILRTAYKGFAKFISKTMFSWYAMQHLYARQIAIKSHRGDTTFKEDQFLRYVKSDNYSIPMALDEYLCSIGNIDYATTKYQVHFPVWPNNHGHFGRVTDKTHYKYETSLAPRVLSQAILEDLMYTRDPTRSRNWNLPENLRPIEENAGLPTKNLLGWCRSTTLTTEQRESLEGLGLDEDNFEASILQFQMNEGLFERIAYFVRASEKVINLSNQISESVNGSVAPARWQERDVTNPENFSRTTAYLEREVCQCGPVQEVTNERALIMALRTKKEQIIDKRSYSCYDFGEYLAVPDTWHDTRNKIFEFGRADTWNNCTYRSAYRGKDDVRTSWIRKGLLKNH